MKWSSTSKKCVCDTNSGHSFIYNNVRCVDCLLIPGGLSLASSKTSCNCIRGYRWSTSRCVCDSSQNFITFKQRCIECLSIKNSNGLAFNSSDCVCNLGLRWRSGACICILGQHLQKGQTCDSCGNNTDFISCSNSVGYVSSNNVCYQCNAQFGVVNSTVTNNACSCSADMVWSPAARGCVCKPYSSSGFIWTYNTTWKCQIYTLTQTNNCGGSSVVSRYISAYTLCHLCRYDPNAAPFFNSS